MGSLFCCIKQEHMEANGRPTAPQRVGVELEQERFRAQRLAFSIIQAFPSKNRFSIGHSFISTVLIVFLLDGTQCTFMDSLGFCFVFFPIMTVRLLAALITILKGSVNCPISTLALVVNTEICWQYEHGWFLWVRVLCILRSVTGIAFNSSKPNKPVLFISILTCSIPKVCYLFLK